MDLLHPEAMWLLLLFIPLMWLQYKSHLGRGVFYGLCLAVIRSLILIAFVLALAAPIITVMNESRTHVFIADLSPSMEIEDIRETERLILEKWSSLSSEDSFELVVFDEQPELIKEFQPSPLFLENLRPFGQIQKQGSGSSPGRALEFAGGLINHNGLGSVSLYTDGMETTGSIMNAAYHLVDRDIAVAVRSVGRPRENEVILKSLDMVNHASIGSTVLLQAGILASGPSQAELEIRSDSEPSVLRAPLDLSAGENKIVIPLTQNRPGTVTYEAEIQSERDTLTDNNTMFASLEVTTPVVVGVMEADMNKPVENALRLWLGNSGMVCSVTPFMNASELDALQLLVIADTPADYIPDSLQKEIQHRVENGLGLLVTGGRRAFGPGGYAGTRLAEILPLQFVQTAERRDPSTTLVIIIDTSGSMTGARVNLAKEIARLAIARLKPHDKVGIVEFYGSKRWAAPIQSASNVIDLQRALNRLSAGGGTVILPAIEESFYALLNVKTRTRHVLVLTDGGVESGAFEPLIRKMAEKGITLSTVLIGPDTHSSFLSSLSQWGHGRFYTASDRFGLPEIIVKQPENALMSSLVELPTLLRVKMMSPILQDISFEAAPTLYGYTETEAQPTADVLLETEQGHPYLARWQFGLGRVAALTSQLAGEWSQDLVMWEGYPKLIKNLIRSLAAVSAEDALSMAIRTGPEGVEIQIDNQINNSHESITPIQLTLKDNSKVSRTWMLDPLEPGSWNLRIKNLKPDIYHLTAKTASGRLQGKAAFSVNTVPEVSSLAPETVLLNEVNMLQSQASQMAGTLDSSIRRPYELWPWLAFIALVLFLTEILWRRWPVSDRRRLSLKLVVAGLLLSIGVCQAAEVNDNDIEKIAPEIESLIQQASSTSILDCANLFPEICRLQLSAQGDLDSLMGYLGKQQETPSVLMLLAETAERNGDLETAAQAFRKLISLQPDTPFLYARLARTFALEGDSRQALAAIEQGLSLNLLPEEKLSLQLHRLMLLYSRDDQSADDELALLARSYKDEPWTRHYLGILAGLNGNNALAAELRRADADDPGEAYYHYLFLGLFYLRSENYDSAAKAYESAYNNAVLERDRAFALERMISTARIANQLEPLAETWLQEDNLSADKTAALVMILREIGRSEEILNFWRQCSANTPSRAFMESPEFQSDFISICLETGNIQQAESIYLNLMATYPDRQDYLISLVRLKLLNDQTAEAMRLFEQAIAGADTENQVLSLAEGAASLALDDLALVAANKLQSLSDSGRIRGGIFRAILLRERGGADAAVKLLREIRNDPSSPPFSVMLAETFERMGYLGDALSIYQDLYRETRTEDILLHIAWLLEETGQTEQAYGLWLELWENTQVAARLKQSQQRLLDIASRIGKLAELALRLEQRIDAKTATHRELELLVQIYETANDPVSAAEILMEFSRSDHQTVQLKERLVHVYLACEQFGRADAILKDLMTADPDNACDYLQQRALIALECGQSHQVRSILSQLKAAARSDKIADEFSAGVLDMAGQHLEAVRCYERLIAQYPDRIESLLLWANALNALGQGKKAAIRFEILLENAAEDDLFTVAVDGLLNLNAPAPTMRRALQRVFIRIAANPRKVFLYQLAADILESLGKEAQMADVLEMAVVVAGERRSQMLRELMDQASGNGWIDRQIYYGRALLDLGDEMPPQVFLSLGEAMVRQNEPHEAEKAFNRAILEGDYQFIQRQVASFYEEAGLPADADRVIRNLLITQPDDITLLIRSGIYREQQGDFTSSFEQYRRAVEIMLGIMPMVSDISSAANEAKTTHKKAINKDEVERYFDTAAGGLLGTIRTPEKQKELNAFLFQRITQELDGLSSLDRRPESLEQCPRLFQLTKFARQYAFSFHQPNQADELDKRLLDVFPQDDHLRQNLITSRLEWGLFDRGLAFTKEDNASSMPSSLLIWKLLQHPDDIPRHLGQLSDSLDKLVEVLILTGHHQQAREVIRYALSHAEDDDALAEIMMDASLALEDVDLYRDWLDLSINRIWKLSKAKEIAFELEMLLRRNWNYLSSAQQRSLMERLLSQCSSSGLQDRIYLDAFCYKSGFVEKDPEIPRKLLEAEAQDAITLEMLQEWLPRCEPEQQLSVLQSIVSSFSANSQRQFILELTGGWSHSFDAQTMEALEHLFIQAPPIRLTAAAGYSMLIRSGWNRNPRQKEMGRRLGEILLSGAANSPAVLMAVAIARENAELHDQAVLLFDEALDLILTSTEPNFQDQIMLKDAVRILTIEDIEAILLDLDMRQSVEGTTPMLFFCKGILNDAAERYAETCKELSNAYKLSPSSRPISRCLISTLENNGNKVMLSRLLSKSLTKSSIMESYEWRKLASVNYELANPLAALAAAQKDASPLGIIWVMRLNHEMGLHSRIHILLRRFITTCRNDSKFYSPFWPDDPDIGGMSGWLRQQREIRADQPRLFQALADLPGIQQEYNSLIQAAPPERNDIPGLISGLVESAVTNAAAGELTAALEDSLANKATNVKDQAILWTLMEREPNAVPVRFSPQILDSLVLPLQPRALENLAGYYLNHGDQERCRTVLNWLIIRELRDSGRFGIDPARFFNWVDDYLSTLPEEHKEAYHLKILNLLAFTPFDKFNQKLDVVRLQRFRQLQDHGHWEAEVQLLAAQLDKDPAPENLPRLWKALFQFHAIKGNYPECVRILKTYFSFNKLDRDSVRESDAIIDFRELLALDLDDLDKTLAIIMAHIEENMADRNIPLSRGVKSICLLSQWLSANGFEKQAQTLNEKALSLAGEIGEHWLWIVDACALAGQPRKSLELQESLFQADMLPVIRIQEFFETLEQSEGAASTLPLAQKAAQYSNHPEILIRAINNCQAREDAPLEKTLKTRFQKNWPQKYAQYEAESIH